MTGTVIVAPRAPLILPICRIGSRPVAGAGNPVGIIGISATAVPEAERAMAIASLLWMRLLELMSETIIGSAI